MQVVLDARSYRLASSAKVGNGLMTYLVPESNELPLWAERKFKNLSSLSMQFRERKSLHLVLKLLPAHEPCCFMLANKHKRAVEVAGIGENCHSAR